MQRVIFDYRARKINVGNPQFATSENTILSHQYIMDNAIEVASGDITLEAVVTPSLFTATNANYLQLISASPFYIKTTINTTTSNINESSLFSYFNKLTPLGSIELYNGSTIYDPVGATFTTDAGTVSQIVTYLLMRF